MCPPTGFRRGLAGATIGECTSKAGLQIAENVGVLLVLSGKHASNGKEMSGHYT